MAVTLVTGGARSGKSRHAEHLVSDRASVTYVATGQAADGTDPEWSSRVARHRDRRPATWEIFETLDLVGVLAAGGGPVIIDCLGTWLTGLVDEAAAWEDLGRAGLLVHSRATDLCVALLAATRTVVIVTNEVGMSLVPQTASGRFFQDQLGALNAAVAAVSNHLHLVVAGRVIDLSNAPLVP